MFFFKEETKLNQL